MKSIYLWYIRNFKIISDELAESLGLEHKYNLHGDGINLWNCRSIWTDKKDRWYRVENATPIIK